MLFPLNAIIKKEKQIKLSNNHSPVCYSQYIRKGNLLFTGLKQESGDLRMSITEGIRWSQLLMPLPLRREIPSVRKLVLTIPGPSLKALEGITRLYGFLRLGQIFQQSG